MNEVCAWPEESWWYAERNASLHLYVEFVLARRKCRATTEEKKITRVTGCCCCRRTQSQPVAKCQSISQKITHIDYNNTTHHARGLSRGCCHDCSSPRLLTQKAFSLFFFSIRPRLKHLLSLLPCFYAEVTQDLVVVDTHTHTHTHKIRAVKSRPKTKDKNPIHEVIWRN